VVLWGTTRASLIAWMKGEASELIQPSVATQCGTSACMQVGVVYTRRVEWRIGLVLIINNGRTPMVEHGLYWKQSIRSVLRRKAQE
jgi:hypothetical protein